MEPEINILKTKAKDRENLRLRLQGAHGLKGNEGPHGPPGPAVSTSASGTHSSNKTSSLYVARPLCATGISWRTRSLGLRRSHRSARTPRAPRTPRPRRRERWPGKEVWNEIFRAMGKCRCVCGRVDRPLHGGRKGLVLLQRRKIHTIVLNPDAVSEIVPRERKDLKAQPEEMVFRDRWVYQDPGDPLDHPERTGTR